MKASVPYGAWPILLTPFNSTGGVDWLALDHIIDFYIAHQVPAILALGQASEVLALNMEECFEIDKRITLRSNGKIYTVAVGNFGLTLEKQAESLIRTVELGIDVAVVALSLLPSSDGLDDQLIRLADMTGNSIPLGIYELPEPEHRVLTPQQVKTIAQSGQYVFMKDTCRQITTFTEKVKAARGSNLKVFQANLQILLSSLKIGCHGFCGHMSIVAPELMSQVCNKSCSEETRKEGFKKLFDLQIVLREQGFPASAKYVLNKRGVQLETRCRVTTPEIFTSENTSVLDKYLAEQDRFSLI